MGIGSVFGSSSTSQKKTTVYDIDTKISNETSTIGDIGLTGKDAVNFATTLGNTSSNLLKISAENNRVIMNKQANTLQKIADTNVIQQKEAANYAQGLISSGEQYVSTAKQQGAQVLQASEKALSAAEGQAKSLITAAGTIGQSENKNLVPYIMLGMVGVIFALKGLK